MTTPTSWDSWKTSCDALSFVARSLVTALRELDVTPDPYPECLEALWNLQYSPSMPVEKAIDNATTLLCLNAHMEDYRGSHLRYVAGLVCHPRNLLMRYPVTVIRDATSYYTKALLIRESTYTLEKLRTTLDSVVEDAIYAHLGVRKHRDGALFPIHDDTEVAKELRQRASRVMAELYADRVAEMLENAEYKKKIVTALRHNLDRITTDTVCRLVADKVERETDTLLKENANK